jgi:hypothetical protein
MEDHRAIDPGVFLIACASLFPCRGAASNANAIEGVGDFRGRVSVKLQARTGKLPVSETHAHLFRQM